MGKSKYLEKIEKKRIPLAQKQDINYINMRISQMVELARLEKGLTQAELAKKVGTKQPSIARLESGETPPSILFLNKIAKALNTHLIEPRFESIEHCYESYNTPKQERSSYNLNTYYFEHNKDFMFSSIIKDTVQHEYNKF